MSATTTVRSAEIERQIAERRTAVAGSYPALWQSMLSAWSSPDPEDRVWLLYSANYLFRTGGVRWALDPLRLSWRVPQEPEVNLAALKALSFVLLTHTHADHLDLGLISALRHDPIVWVIPPAVLPVVIEQCGLSLEKVIVPAPLQPIRLNDMQITPFNGLHWETPSTGARRGVPAMGYLVEFSGKRWLLPGDTRTYEAAQLPDFGALDGLFAHLWLGRGCALLEEPPLLEDFCRFCLDLHARRILVTHLEEFGRSAQDTWRSAHAMRVIERIGQENVKLCAQAVFTGESVQL